MDDVDPTGATLASVTRAAAGATLTEAGGRSASPSPGLVGKQLAHFRIDRAIGAGGMGEVYLATDLALDRRVALKILPRDLSARPDFRQKFIREARSQAGLNHPNICHIYFIGEEDEQLFFAMEYVEGETLEARLRRLGKLVPTDAIELVRQAALGLREAEEHGITHRDIKPSNLIVDARGALKLLDFGLAACEGDEGEIAGTPLYMAPEQGRGEPVDLRADVYALGATLHHLLAGAPPFQGATPAELVTAHGTAPRPRLVASHVDVLCDRMMAKRPADRFATYDQLLAVLDRLAPSVSHAAGFWARSFAFGIDLVTVLFLALPFLVLKLLEDPAILLVGALYSIVAHAIWGRTLGKLALEIEVVPSDRAGRLGFLRASIRWLVELGPTYLLIGLGNLFMKLRVPMTYLAPLGGVLLVMLPITIGIAGVFATNKRTLWDKAARSQVRYTRKSA